MFEETNSEFTESNEGEDRFQVRKDRLYILYVQEVQVDRVQKGRVQKDQVLKVRVLEDRVREDRVREDQVRKDRVLEEQFKFEKTGIWNSYYSFN